MEAGTPANQSPNPEPYIDRPPPRAQPPPGQGKKRGKKNRRERTPETEEDEPSQEHFTMDAGTDSYLEFKDELEKEYHTINEMDPPEIIERANFPQAVAAPDQSKVAVVKDKDEEVIVFANDHSGVVIWMRWSRRPTLLCEDD